MHEVLQNEVKDLEYQQKRIAILAARKKEVSLTPSRSSSSQSSSNSSGSSASDRAGDLASGGGSGSMQPGGGGSGSMMPGSGSGGKKSGRSGSRKSGSANPLEDLPAYRIELSRRRIKTISTSLIRSFGETAGPTGMLRWANGNAALLPKLSKYKQLLLQADKAAEAGLSDSPGGKTTHLLIRELNSVADKLAQILGLNPPPKGNAAAKGDPAKEGKAKKGKSGGDAFLNGN